MEDYFILQIGGTILVFTMIIIAWLIVRISNAGSYYYRNLKTQDYIFNRVAFKKKYIYDAEPQFYSETMEQLKNFLNFDYYFINHEIKGNEKQLGKFQCFITRTSDYSFLKQNIERAKFRITEKYLKNNFTGLVFSYQYIAGFANEFVLFASKDNVYFDSEESLNFPLLFNYWYFKNVEKDIWILHKGKFVNGLLHKFIKDFSNLYHKCLVSDCSMIVVYSNCCLNIIFIDEYIYDANRLEKHLDYELANIKKTVKFFNWFKNNSKKKISNNAIPNKTNAYLDITRNSNKQEESQKNSKKASKKPKYVPKHLAK